jgi:hypothetical protein
VDVSGVELGGLLEEEESGMGVHHILYEGHHVLWDEMCAVPTCDKRHKLRGLVMTAGRQPAIRAQPFTEIVFASKVVIILHTHIVAFQQFYSITFRLLLTVFFRSSRTKSAL